MDGGSGAPRRVIVVGSGTRFLSGISVYTVRLANALAERHVVGIITMRRLLPTHLYPGRQRVGADLSQLQTDPRVTTLDGVDWFWLPSMLRAMRFLLWFRPEFVILEWWTGTVAHSYIALALVGRLLGAQIIVEFHEVIETGEANIPVARAYVQRVAPILMRLAHAFAVHSEFDRRLVIKTWSAGGGRPIAVLPHGPHDHYQGAVTEPNREAPSETTNVLFFGVIRPYKGLEHLIRAFEAIPEAQLEHFWLTVVGETWEGWSLPTDLIVQSPRRRRITFVNRYVTDEELHAYLEGADAVALPYLRSSLSGPLHVAMAYGLPIVMTDVGGNVEAAQGYEGIVTVPPGEEAPLTEALLKLPLLSKHRYQHPSSWAKTASAYELLFKASRSGGGRRSNG